VLGRVGAGRAVDYAASKFAVTGFVEALRQELYHTGVHLSVIFPGLINTGMFDGVTHRFPFLTPQLDIETVADEMFSILERNTSQQVVLPFYVRLSPILACLPVEINDFLHRIMGANDDLKGYKGSLSKIKYEST
jgi:all-trans-retinol dehydrogenase (NAD+)